MNPDRPTLDFFDMWQTVNKHFNFFLALPPVVYRNADVLFMLFLLLHVQHVFTIWVIWQVSYRRQKPLTLLEHLGSPLVFDGVRDAPLFSFLCCVLFVDSSLDCPRLVVLRFSLTFICYKTVNMVKIISYLRSYP